MASFFSRPGLQCRQHTDHAHTVSSTGIVPVLTLRARKSHRLPERPLMVLSSMKNNSSSSRDSNKQASAPSSSSSPAKLLHTLESTAIAIAAVGQAALLISTAICQWRQTQQLSELQDQLHSMDDTLAEAAASGTPTAKASTRHQQDLHHNHDAVQHQQYQAAAPVVPHAAHAGLHLLTGSALVVGLLCGAGLRQLQLRSVVQQSSKSSSSATLSTLHRTVDWTALPATACQARLLPATCNAPMHFKLQPRFNANALMHPCLLMLCCRLQRYAFHRFPHATAMHSALQVALLWPPCNTLPMC